MWFKVDHKRGSPIYQQIMEELRNAIALGVLFPGERLPSVRHLSLDISVNPNTVARAYRELEREGVIATAVGSGSFVVGPPGDNGKKEGSIFRKSVRRALQGARKLGLSKGEVFRVMEEETEVCYAGDDSHGKRD